MTAVEHFPSFAPLAELFDAFILDVWGVIHDGQKLYPGARECLRQLRDTGKRVVLLSNAPRRAATVTDALGRMGVGSDMYDALITSGETAYQCLADNESPFFVPAGRNYIYIGLEKDRRILGGLPFQETNDPAAAYFLLLAHSQYDNQALDELEPMLSGCLAAGLPALCINPDMEVVRQNGERVYCAGVLAAEYAARGGQVIYFGKPHHIVYDVALAVLSEIDVRRIAVVGDNLATDIAGANHAALVSMFVAGGIFGEQLGEPGTEAYAERCAQLFEQAGVTPDYVIPTFSW